MFTIINNSDFSKPLQLKKDVEMKGGTGADSI